MLTRYQCSPVLTRYQCSHATSARTLPVLTSCHQDLRPVEQQVRLRATLSVSSCTQNCSAAPTTTCLHGNNNLLATHRQHYWQHALLPLCTRSLRVLYSALKTLPPVLEGCSTNQLNTTHQSTISAGWLYRRWIIRQHPDKHQIEQAPHAPPIHAVHSAHNPPILSIPVNSLVVRLLAHHLWSHKVRCPTDLTVGPQCLTTVVLTYLMQHHLGATACCVLPLFLNASVTNESNCSHWPTSVCCGFVASLGLEGSRASLSPTTQQSE